MKVQQEQECPIEGLLREAALLSGACAGRGKMGVDLSDRCGPSMNMIPGVYQLRIRLKADRRIRVGALGVCRFERGWYVYTGSARNGLEQRIGRHFRKRKRRHWHIDYLLAVADSVEAFVCPGTEVPECDLHGSLTGGSVPVSGFGSSDCRCQSHLAYFTHKPAIELMRWDTFSGRRAHS